MLLLPFIPIIALLMQTSSSLFSVLTYRMEVTDVETQVLVATDLGRIVTRLQLERGDVAYYIFTNRSVERSDLLKRFALTNETIDDTTAWTKLEPNNDNTTEENETLFIKSNFMTKLNDFRDKILSDESNNTVFEIMIWYMNVNSALLDRISNQIKESDRSGIWRYLISFKTLIRAIENIGVSAVYGINFYSRGFLEKESYISYLKYDTLGKDLLNSSLTLLPFLKDEYRKLTQFKDYGTLKNRSLTITQNKYRNQSIEDAKAYFLVMTEYINQLRVLHSFLRDRIK